MRCVIIGIDGGTWDLVEPWAREGHLPHFARILAEGATGPLRSTIHPLSAPAWASFITGKNPGKHGVFDFVTYSQASHRMEVVNRRKIRSASLWRTLSDAGKRVCSVNVPLTYPPEEVNGNLVAGWLAPGKDSNFTFPASLKEELLDVAGNYIFEPGVEHYGDTVEAHEQFLSDIAQSMDVRNKVLHHLWTKEDWDIFMNVFIEADRVQYKFWRYLDPNNPDYHSEGAEKYRDSVLQVYKQIDSTLGDLMSDMKNDSVLMIMSDHGFGPLHHIVFLNKWLSDEGYLHVKSRKGVTGKSRGAVLKAIRLLIQWVRWGPFRSFEKHINLYLPKVRDLLLSTAVFGPIDWEKTQAFSLGYGGNIYLNLRDRQPCGIVAPGEEYEALREKIISGLSNLTSPETGELLVEKVHRREELFHGPAMEEAPDLLVEWKNYECWSNLDFEIDRPNAVIPSLSDQFYKRAGDHKLDGMLAVFGEKVCRGVRIEEASIVDLFPTILYALDAPIPDDVDGRILTEVFSSEFNRNRGMELAPPQTPEAEGSVYTPEEEQEIEDRLRQLGYLD